MARKKQNIEEPLLSQEEVFDVLRFAQNVYGNAVYNPMLVNERLKDISMSPLVADVDKVQEALQDPKNHEGELLGYSEFFQLTSMLYQRMLNYLAGMLSFDLTYLPKNEMDEKDFKSPAYKKDMAIVADFLDRFNLKQEFATILKQMLRQEVYFGVLRDEGEKYTMQELPPTYCKITGRWDYGMLFDFNIYWFWQPGTSLDMYPNVFTRMYNQTLGNKSPGSSQLYNPATMIGSRDSSWVYWVQTDPADGFWTFKFSPEIVSRVPFLAPLFSDVVLQPLIRKLQTNTYIAAASKLVVGQVPLLNKDVKSASVRDMVSMTPDTLGKFLGLLKAGLGDAIKVGAAPLEDIQGISFPLDNDAFYQKYLQTTAASSGINSRLIYTFDKNNAIDSQVSINVDEYLMEYVYPTFANFLEYHINRRTKKYKFKFIFEGTKFFTNRKERFDRQMTLAGMGIVNHQKIAAASGMLPHEFEKQLAMTKASGFVEKLTPIVTSFQMGANKADGAGRPKKDDSELSESGSQTRSDGGNIEKGGEE